MRVTIVVGGRWHAFDLAKELYEEGHLYRLITNYPKWFVRQWGIPEDKVVSLPATFIAVRLIYKLGGEALMMRLQWKVHQWFSTRAANYLDGSEIIHGWSQWSEPSFEWAKKRGIPTVLERSSAHILEQSQILDEEYKRLGLRWTRTHPLIEQMELREYNLSTRIAVPSLFVERSFNKRGIKASKLFRNSLGVNLEKFKAREVISSSPREVGLKAVYAGSVSVRKGIHDLLEGFKLADLKDSSLTLVGGMTPEMKDLVSSQSKDIVAVGHKPQDELLKFYERSHCFVIASVEEGMAMVQMQALACGLPLICTMNTGGEDLLRMGSNELEICPHGALRFSAGFVIPVNNTSALAWCLCQLATVNGLWEQQRDSALQVAEKCLSWKSYGERAIELYKELTQ